MNKIHRRSTDTIYQEYFDDNVLLIVILYFVQDLALSIIGSETKDLYPAQTDASLQFSMTN
ncbi:MAG: hypothetical protein LUE93_02780 [Bacteroides sp.]|nr:hypothetical protein [Bacteroides sp.]